MTERIPTPEESGDADPEGVWRIEARPVEEVRAGKQELIPYEEAEPVAFEPPIAVPVYGEFDAAKSFADLKGEIAAMKDKKLPRDVRHGRIRARLGEIRKRLAYQEKGIAEAIKTLWRVIEQNPNENDRDLFRVVAELAPKYYFSNDELREFWDAIVQYRDKHRHVERYRKEYPNDTALFEACFGRKPEGIVKVTARPMLLYFHCYDDNDYVAADTYAETQGDAAKETSVMRERALMGAGAVPKTVKIPELQGLVAIERSALSKLVKKGNTLAHEEQHIINKLFEPITWRAEQAEVIEHAVRASRDVREAKAMLIAELLRLERKKFGIDARARDEILAYYRGGHGLGTMLKYIAKHPLYNFQKFYESQIADVPKKVADTVMENMSNVLYLAEEERTGSEPRDVDVQSVQVTPGEVEMWMKQIFTVEYRKDLRRWIGALETLEQKGYTRDDIVAMLYGERVIDWSAFARRAPEKGK